MREPRGAGHYQSLGVRVALLEEMQGKTQDQKFQYDNLGTDKYPGEKYSLLFQITAAHNGSFANKIGHQSFLWQPGS